MDYLYQKFKKTHGLEQSVDNLELDPEVWEQDHHYNLAVFCFGTKQFNSPGFLVLKAGDISYLQGCCKEQMEHYFQWSLIKKPCRMWDMNTPLSDGFHYLCCRSLC